MEYTPKKVFVLEDGTYLELSCAEFRRREDTYRDYRFIPLHGMLYPSARYADGSTRKCVQGVLQEEAPGEIPEGSLKG